MSAPRFVIILVDALGWELASRRPGFLPELPHRRRLETVLGFSSAALPSLFTGRRPSEHGHWLMYRRAGRDGVFAPLRPLRWAPRRLRESYRLGRALHRWLERRGVEGYFQLYQVPRALLPEFDLCQRRDIFRAGALAPDSWWDTLARHGIPARVWQWRTAESESLAALVEHAGRPGEPVLFCYTAELDAALHREGSGGAGVARHLERYQQAVRALRAGSASHWIYLLSDHGMVDVEGTVDVMGALAALPGRWPRDYLAFFDSTFARFWWRNGAARGAVRDALAGLGRGHWMDDAELEREGALFPDRAYGEDIFLLDPGWLMVPSFMGSSALKGMHGYHPSHPQMSAALFSNRPLPEGLDHLCQVRSFLETELQAFEEAA